MNVVHPILGVMSTKSVSYIISLLKRSITKWWRIHCHLSLLQISLQRDISNYQLPSLQGLALSLEVIHGSLSLICQTPNLLVSWNNVLIVNPKGCNPNLHFFSTCKWRLLNGFHPTKEYGYSQYTYHVSSMVLDIKQYL